MKKLLLFLSLLLFTTPVLSQITVTVGTTPSVSGVLRPGINLGGNSSGYGMAQMLKSLNQMNFGYLPPPIYQITYPCSSGGTTNTTTSYYGGPYYSANGFPANFWAGATYTAVSQTGSTPVSGTIVSSTANTGTTGITFTLSNPLSAPCTPGGDTTSDDYLIVRQRNVPVGVVSPTDYNLNPQGVFSSDAPNGNYQSLILPSGTSQNFYIDAVFGTWAPDPTKTSVTWLNLNGSYTLVGYAKCTGTSGSVIYSFGRIGSSYLVSGTFNIPACNATSGQGWYPISIPFTANETGSQSETLQLSFLPTYPNGQVMLWGMDVVEGSTLAGNTTPFRDAVVRELQKINPGSLRLMTPASWSSAVPCQIATIGLRCVSGLNGEDMASLANSIGDDDFLQLAYLLKTEPYITLGHFNTPADMTTWVNWLQSSGWHSKFATLGLKIHTADGNEPWNPGAQGSQDAGNGLGYGTTLGQKVLAFRAASGYNSSVDRIVGSDWFSGSQGFYNSGGTWVYNVLRGANCTSAGAPGCPDELEIAPYTFNYVSIPTFPTAHTDEVVEGANQNTVNCPYTACTLSSTQAVEAMLSQTFNMNATIYEQSYSPSGGNATMTQAQMNQLSSSVSMALNTYRNMLLEERDAKIYGPRNEFAFTDQPYNGACCGVQQTAWTAEQYMACGPGQLTSCVDIPRAIGIIMEVGNTAIGNNSNLMPCTQAGVPTFSFTEDANQIASNPSVNYADIFCKGDGAGHFTIIAFNMNPTTNYTLTFAGSGSPSSSTVTKYVFGGPANALTDTNIDSLSQNSPSAVIGRPSPTTLTAPTSDTLPAGSMTVYTYTVGGTPSLTPPTITPSTGTYSGAQTVTITGTSGATICVGNGTTPTAPTPGTCGSGGAAYTGPITVSSTATIAAIQTESGFNNSSSTSATLTITSAVVSTPTFSPVAGTYSATQNVTISTSTSGATIYYTLDGSTPTTGSAVYSSVISVASSETIKALAVASGFTNSSIASAAYTIMSPTAATPVFTPVAGSYSGSTNVTLTCSTASSTMYYTTNGTTPTTSSTLYTTSIVVATSETIKAICTASGSANSAVASAAYTITSPSQQPVELNPLQYSFSAFQAVAPYNNAPGYTTVPDAEIAPASAILDNNLFASTGNFTAIQKTDTAATFAVSGGVGTVTTTAAAGSTYILGSTASSFKVPDGFVEVEINQNGATSATDNVGVGLFSSTVTLDAEITNTGQVYIGVLSGGTFTTLGSTTFSAPTAPWYLGFSLVGSQATAWANTGSGWTMLVTRDVSGYYDPRNLGNMTNLKSGIKLSTSVATTWQFSNLKSTVYGGVGVRDISVITYEDGRPYMRGPVAYFLATVASPVNSYKSSGNGIFSYNVTTGVLQLIGTLAVGRSANYFEDQRGQIIYDPVTNKERLLMGTYGSTGATPTTIYTSQTITTDDWLAVGEHFTPATVTLTVANYPNPYDAHMVCSAWNYSTLTCSNWIMAVAGGTGQEILTSTADPISNSWTVLSNDTTNVGYEGARISRFRIANQPSGVSYYFSYGGTIASDLRGSLVYNQAGTVVGSINAPWPAGSLNPSHPDIFEYGNTEYLVSFTDRLYGAGIANTASLGNWVVATAPKYQTQVKNPQLVTQKETYSAAAATSTTITGFTATVGDLFVAVCRGSNNAITAAPITSSSGTFTSLGLNTNAPSGVTWFENASYSFATTAGVTSFTCTPNSSSTSLGLTVLQFHPGFVSGADSKMAYSNSTSSQTLQYTSTAFSTTAKGLIVVCGDVLGSGTAATYQPGLIGPYVGSFGGGLTSGSAACQAVVTTGAQSSITGTLYSGGSAGYWGGAVLSFK